MKWLEKSSQSNLTAEEIESNLEKAEEAALGALEADDTLKIDFGLEEWLPRKRKSPAVYGDFARGKKWKTSKKVTRSSRGEPKLLDTGVDDIQQRAGKWVSFCNHIRHNILCLLREISQHVFSLWRTAGSDSLSVEN